MRLIQRRIFRWLGYVAVLLAVLTLSVPLAADQALTVVSFGGSYARACQQAYHVPFTAATGIEVRLEDYNGGPAQIRAQVETGNVHWDVVDLNVADAVLGCDEGLLEFIDPGDLPPGADGSSVEDDFVPGTLTDCGIGTIFFSSIYAYHPEHFPDARPATIEDFFDLERFPGRRGMRRVPSDNLEIALLADGVPPEEIYATLETPEGVERAFRKLDTIKEQIVWWETGAQPPQMLADGEVVMSTAYNGRIFNAQVLENQPFEIVWDGPDPGQQPARDRGRHAQPGGGAQVHRLCRQAGVDGGGEPLHLLRSGTPFRYGPGRHPPGDGSGDGAAHADHARQPDPCPAPRLALVERSRRRDERAFQRLAGALTA